MAKGGVDDVGVQRVTRREGEMGWQGYGEVGSGQCRAVQGKRRRQGETRACIEWVCNGRAHEQGVLFLCSPGSTFVIGQGQRNCDEGYCLQSARQKLLSNCRGAAMGTCAESR